MHLVAPLAAGVAGCGNGTVKLFRRGTDQRATWYADFEAESSNSTGADIPLDANGGAVVYVAEYVRVEVYASTANGGGLVRSFVAGAREDAVEVQSVSFTGTDYETAETGANKPVPLSTVHDRWFDSAQALDWKVSVNGVSTTLVNAVAGSSLFVNVKSPQFGAEGDGTTDDTAAINAAIVYANSLGGGVVYFPPGTYRISSTISLLEDVSMLGVLSANTSIIERATSDAAFVTTTDSSSFIRNLTFQEADSGAAEPYFEVDVTDTLHLEYVQCLAPLTGTTNGAAIFNDDCGSVRMRYCQLTLQGPGGRIASRTGASLVRDTFIIGSTITWGGDNNYAGAIGHVGILRMFDSQIFYNTDVTAPTVLFQLYNNSSVVGNQFRASTALTSITVFLTDSTAGATTTNAIVESGNQFDDKYLYSTVGTGALVAMSQPQRSKDYTVATGAAVDILGEFGIANVVTSGGAGAVTLNFSAGGDPNSSTIFLVLRNPTANNHTITTANTSPVDAGVAVNAGLVARVIYQKRTVGGTTAWFRMTGFTVSAI